jgi:endo-1,4-beta-xylanase
MIGYEEEKGRRTLRLTRMIYRFSDIAAVRLAVIVFFVCLLNSHIPGQVESKPRDEQSETVQTNIPSLKQSLSEYFPVGAAIRLADITGPHGELLKRHFNSITAENAMKWASIEPIKGHLDFSVADSLVRFAKANNMRVRGHTLVWHKQTPAWVFQDENGANFMPTSGNKALLLRRMEKHIRELVSHFKNDVYAWDVVNEVIDPDEPDGFRRSPWFQITGAAYIDAAFLTAHKFAPNAKLYINDYNTTDPRKRAFLLKLVRDLRKRGVPVTGVGHQMHSTIATPSAQSISETIDMFSSLGVDNQVTELDMSLYSDARARELDSPQTLLIRQGYRYRDFFRVFRELKGKISSVTFWGIADDHTWLTNHPIKRRDLPLLFDEHLQAKYAYWGVVEATKLPSI